MLGTSVPSTNTALPIPVPRVITATTPARASPHTKRTSAIPAASASLTTATNRPVVLEKRSTASMPIHAWSMFAAVSTVPPRTTAGRVRPTGPGTPICSRT